MTYLKRKHIFTTELMHMIVTMRITPCIINIADSKKIGIFYFERALDNISFLLPSERRQERAFRIECGLFTSPQKHAERCQLMPVTASSDEVTHSNCESWTQAPEQTSQYQQLAHVNVHRKLDKMATEWSDFFIECQSFDLKMKRK